jgi:predicted RNase H-like nuclease (RuvC/YqgF family)
MEATSPAAHCVKCKQLENKNHRLSYQLNNAKEEIKSLKEKLQSQERGIHAIQ